MKPQRARWERVSSLTVRMSGMNGPADEYRHWRSIDYRPALSELSAEHLAAYLDSGQRALEVGCNRGRTALWLASHGVETVGIYTGTKTRRHWCVGGKEDKRRIEVFMKPATLETSIRVND